MGFAPKLFVLSYSVVSWIVCVLVAHTVSSRPR